MKLENNKKQDIKSNLKGNSFESDISDPKVMMLIVRAKLYAHKLRTPIQEYIANGMDSHVVAKNEHTPLRIVLPTHLEPILKIRDFGTGMSEEKIRKTFSQYTASDKRNDLNLIGGFGLGSKSAFAYTDKFTVISYFNKQKIPYIAHAPSDLDLIFTSLAPKGPLTTDEPNGVEIQIPIKPEDISQTISAVIRMSVLLPVCPEIINYPTDFKKTVFDAFKNAALETHPDYVVFQRNLIPSSVIDALNIDRNDYFINYNHIPYIIPNHQTNTFDGAQAKSRNKLIVMFNGPRNTFQIPPSREMLVEDKKYFSFLEEKKVQLLEWNKNFREKEKTLLESLSDLDEVKKTLSNLKFNFEEFEKPLTLGTFTLPCLVKNDRVAYKINHSTMTVSRFQSSYRYNQAKSHRFQVKENTYRPADPSKDLRELYFLFNPTEENILLTCKDDICKISLDNTNKLRHFFKNKYTVDSILLVKEDSPFAGVAQGSLENIELSLRARPIPLYYTYTNRISGYEVEMGQSNFAAQIPYNYIEVPEGIKTFELESWIVSELTRNGARLVFLPAETIQKIQKRKTFKKVDLNEIRSRDPREKLKKKEIEFVELMNCALNDHGSKFFWEFVTHVFNNKLELEDTWLMTQVNNLAKFKEYEAKFKLTLITGQFERYHTPESYRKFSLDKEKFLNRYPLISSLKYNTINESACVHMIQYIEVMLHARRTGILKSE